MKKLITKLTIVLTLALCVCLVVGMGMSADAQTHRYEAESTPFTVTDTDGTTTDENKATNWAWSLSIDKAVGVSGDLTYFRNVNLGGTVDFVIDVDDPGEHSFTWAFRPHNESYSTVEIYINGEKIGEEVSLEAGVLVGDLMNSWDSVVRTITMGNADFKAGENTVTIKMVGAGKKNAFTIDYFELGEPVDESTLVFIQDIPNVATKENSTPLQVSIPAGMKDEYKGVSETPKTTEKITVYPLPECYKPSEQYTLTVDGAQVPVTPIKVYNADGEVIQYEYAHFDYDASKGEVTMVIECSASVRSVVVSPQYMGLDAKISGKKITLTISENYNYNLRINDKNLCISADPMQTDVPASTGEGIFNITEAPYSVNGEMTDAEVTAAVQQALDDASAYGSTKGNKNGVVYIPAGVYYVGNLVVSSNTYLYIEGGAALRITSDTSLLTVHGNKTSMTTPSGEKGLDFTWWITTKTEGTGKNVEGSYDIRISGRGTLDGRDGEFWNTSLEGNHTIANNTVIPIACSDFTLEGLVIREGICWSVIGVRSNDMTFEWLKLYQLVSHRQYEDDCIDICECQDVTVSNCIGFSRDDPFSTKCWPYKTGITINWAGYPEYLDNVTFEHCMSYTKCYGYKVGQGSNQNQYNVTFRYCTTLDAARGIGIHLKSGEGTVNGIVFDNCHVEKINSVTGDYCVWLHIYTEPNSRGNGNVDGVTISNTYVYKEAIGDKFIEFKGYDSASGIKNVTFSKIYFEGKMAKDLDSILPGLNQNAFVKNVVMKNGDEAENENNGTNNETDKDNETNGNNGTDNKPSKTENSNVGKVILICVLSGVAAAAVIVVVIVLIKKKKAE